MIPLQKQLEVVQAYREGVRLKVIVSDTGVCEASINLILKRHNVPLRRQPSKAKAEILKSWSQGLSKAQIARETGYCWQTVYNTIKAAG